MSKNQTEIAIVGAGIVGLAFALAHAKRGKRVTVFERNPRAIGATIRNFGMVWPVGQPAGLALNRAIKSREIWKETAAKAGFWSSETGSLHLAYQSDEWEVLQEFFATRKDAGYDIALMTPGQVKEKSPAVRTKGLVGALWSGTEMLVEPREVPAKLAAWLCDAFGVEVHFATPVTAISGNCLETPGGTWQFDRCFICCGDDLETLCPEAFKDSGITKSKLQMMRTGAQPDGWRIGPSLAGGLTLTHYASFAHCSSLQKLKDRIDSETPWFNQWGIHVMMAQNGKGELVIGDSHEYGDSFDPFMREEINRYILDYLWKFAQAPDRNIQERWYGVYSKLPGKTEFRAEVAPNVILVTGLSGAGMTLSFGLAEEVVSRS